MIIINILKPKKNYLTYKLELSVTGEVSPPVFMKYAARRELFENYLAWLPQKQKNIITTLQIVLNCKMCLKFPL